MRTAAATSRCLFKGGDMGAHAGQRTPEADPRRTRPEPGDHRLLFAVMDDKPVCVLYEPVVAAGKAKAPRTFSSPTGTEEFDRVTVVTEAEVKVERSDVVRGC